MQLFKKILLLFSFLLWGIGDLSAQGFITTWQSPDGNITIPTDAESGTYNYEITWKNLTNPGQSEGYISGQTGDYTLTGLSKNNLYEVEITGDFPHFYMNTPFDIDYVLDENYDRGEYDTTEVAKLKSIEQWGNIIWTSMYCAFRGCFNMKYNAQDKPNLSKVESMAFMFANCILFNGNINDWNVSQVVDMSDMFSGAIVFNQPLEKWDVSQVVDMSDMFSRAIVFNQPLEKWDVSQVKYMNGMFSGAVSFNQPLEKWDVRQVTSMYSMFSGATSFNQPLEKWDVSQVTDMFGMFSDAIVFNQPLEKWDVSQVTNMLGMFSDAIVFNQPLEKWDVSQVTGMSYMFFEAASFNQPLEEWDVSQVTDMSGMFSRAASFNQPLEKWDVSQVTYMSDMFSGAASFNQPLEKWDVSQVEYINRMFSDAVVFNQPLEKWDVSQVTSMYGVFSGAASFNQPLEKWDVSQVTSMYGVFSRAASFNQSLDNWDISQVTDMSYMFSRAASFNQPLAKWDMSRLKTDGLTSIFYNCGMDVGNYDKTLIGWATLESGEIKIPKGVYFEANNLQYCLAEEARNTLINTYDWEIKDAGKNCLPYQTEKKPWTQLGVSIDGDEAGDQCGTSVALSADGKVLALSLIKDRYYVGRVRIYDWQGNSWVQRGTDIIEEQRGERFGAFISLSADGNIVAIGAPSNDGTFLNQGQVRVHVWNGSTWEQRGKDINGLWVSSDFGTKAILSADGNVLAIEGLVNPDGYGDGHTAIYAWDGTTWKQRGEMLMDTGGEYQSISLSADGNVLATRIPYTKQKEYCANVYAWNGNAWEQKGNPFPKEEGDWHASALSLSADGNTFAMGVPTEWLQETKRNQIRVFTWNGYDWVRKGGDLDYTTDHTGFGLALSDDGNTLLVLGGSHESSSLNKIRIYTFQNGNWIQKGEVIQQDTNDNGVSSTLALSADGKILVIGDPQNSEKGKYVGKVKVFRYKE